MSKELQLIEYLSLYLPYGVKIMSPGGNIRILTHSESTEYYVSIRSQFIKASKLILKPLGSVTEEELTELMQQKYSLGKLRKYTDDIYQWFIGGEIAEAFCVDLVLQNDYWFVIELIKRHYDVFGLIPQGKAVDYYELNKEV